MLNMLTSSTVFFNMLRFLYVEKRMTEEEFMEIADKAVDKLMEDPKYAKRGRERLREKFRYEYQTFAALSDAPPPPKK